MSYVRKVIERRKIPWLYGFGSLKPAAIQNVRKIRNLAYKLKLSTELYMLITICKKIWKDKGFIKLEILETAASNYYINFKKRK